MINLSDVKSFWRQYANSEKSANRIVRSAKHGDKNTARTDEQVFGSVKLKNVNQCALTSTWKENEKKRKRKSKKKHGDNTKYNIFYGIRTSTARPNQLSVNPIDVYYMHQRSEKERDEI